MNIGGGWQEMKKYAIWQKKLLQMIAEAYGMQSILMEIKSAEDIKDAFCRLAVQAAVKKNGI